MHPASPKSYRDFLCQPTTFTRYYAFYLQDELIAVAVSDMLTHGISAVYSFYATQHHRRSLGIYMILWQIEECKRLGLDALYLGYWVKESEKMAYKTQFKPIELLVNQRWLRMR